MNILITGTADKRVIVYPLLYALNFLGSTLLLTNDTMYRRLLPEGTETGGIGNIHIDTTSRITQEIEHNYECISKEFQHCLIVLFEEINIQADKFYAIRDGDKIETDITLQKKQSYIRIGYSQPKEKENYILLNDSLYRQLYQIEVNSRFVPLKDARMLKTLSSVFAPVFSKSEKDMKKLLLYKGGKIT